MLVHSSYIKWNRILYIKQKTGSKNIKQKSTTDHTEKIHVI